MTKNDLLMKEIKEGTKIVLKGEYAFYLWSTRGLPLEITKDICREHGVDVDEAGFWRAMEEHRAKSVAKKRRKV